MSEQPKPSGLKGMLKRDKPVSIEEMNEVIREQGAAAGRSGTENRELALDDAEASGETRQSIADVLNDSEGNNIEYEPPKLDFKLKPPKL